MHILNLDQVDLRHIAKVGGKAASLGELIGSLGSKGIRVPGGFTVTVLGYSRFLEYNKIKIPNEFNEENKPEQIRYKILNGQMPKDLKDEILEAYSKLDIKDVAVRSSATTEDLHDASFAGQQDTFLHVCNSNKLLQKIKECFASLFNDRAVSYRKSRKFSNKLPHVGIAVVVQEMVRSDCGVSGVAFSLDTETGLNKVVLINATYGLGEMLVSGAITPDEYIVFKETGKLISKTLGPKEKQMVYSEDGEETKIKDIEPDKRNVFSLDDQKAEKLAAWVMIIEKHYSQLHRKYCPVDVEWAVDGINNELYIVQARPETIHSQKENLKLCQYKFETDLAKEVILRGIAVGDKISSGRVKIIQSLKDENDFKDGDILVTDMTNPDWEPLMKRAKAIITNRGGRTCHAAIVAREMGLTAIVGSKIGTQLLINNQDVTVSCAEGEIGYIYTGILPYRVENIDLNQLKSKLSSLKTQIMLNVGSPDLAFKYSALPNKGVGLAREEFIINNYIRIHPLALLNCHKPSSNMKDMQTKQKIKDMIKGYDSASEYFISKLSGGIAKLGAAFWPNEVIMRFSDFKSNEYSNLIGGYSYEPKEENPMLGWRGASRYYSEQYQEAFGLECLAVKRVREEMGLTNIIVMIPFCRSIEELDKVYKVMSNYGLKRGYYQDILDSDKGLKVYIMAEIPSNIIMAEEFAAKVDGFSIGSNDLTQLTLGVDRDSTLVSNVYNERNPAVVKSIQRLISVGLSTKTKVGICGQAPSDFPDFTQMLVEAGIDSISITPDALPRTVDIISKL